VKLGFFNVTAYDHEDESVAIAKENLKKNGVEDKINVFKGDAITYVSEEKFDVVVVNMLAHIVIASAEAIVANLKKSPSSRLILSGCMLHQYDELCEVFTQLGIAEVENRTYDNWKSGVFKLIKS